MGRYCRKYLYGTPFGYADIITTTTHKTLRGPRGGMIFCKPEFAKKVDSAIFPFSQGGPLEHVIAGKAIAAEEALTEEYKNYIHQVVVNCRAMCEEFKKMGYKIIKKVELCPNQYELTIKAPYVTRNAKAGQFIIFINYKIIPAIQAER